MFHWEYFPHDYFLMYKNPEVVAIPGFVLHIL